MSRGGATFMLRDPQKRGWDDSQTDGGLVTEPDGRIPAASDEPAPYTIRGLGRTSRDWDDEATLQDEISEGPTSGEATLKRPARSPFAPPSTRDEPTFPRNGSEPSVALDPLEWEDDELLTEIFDRATKELSGERPSGGGPRRTLAGPLPAPRPPPASTPPPAPPAVSAPAANGVLRPGRSPVTLPMGRGSEPEMARASAPSRAPDVASFRQPIAWAPPPPPSRPPPSRPSSYPPPGTHTTGRLPLPSRPPPRPYAPSSPSSPDLGPGDGRAEPYGGVAQGAFPAPRPSYSTEPLPPREPSRRLDDSVETRVERGWPQSARARNEAAPTWPEHSSARERAGERGGAAQQWGFERAATVPFPTAPVAAIARPTPGTFGSPQPSYGVSPSAAPDYAPAPTAPAAAAHAANGAAPAYTQTSSTPMGYAQPASTPPPAHAPTPASNPPPGYAHPGSMGPMFPASLPPPPPPGFIPASALQTYIPPKPASAGGITKMSLGIAAFSLVLTIGMALMMLFPRRGQLRIELGSEGAQAVQRAEIFVDGRKECDTAPCRVVNLSAGPKTIRVIAPDFVEPDLVTEVVEAGKEKVVVVPLRGTARASAQATLRITAGQPGVRVIVDGTERGTAPVELSNLTAGAHRIRFEGGPRFAPAEQVVEAVGGQVRELTTPALKVKQGTLTVELVSRGATVVLARRETGRAERALSGPWPMKLDVEGEGYRVQASGRGYAPFEQDVTFPDGKAEATIRVELRLASSPEPEAPRPVAAAPVDAPKKPEKASPPEKDEPEPAAASGSGTISMNSIPPSKVLLDGRPIGGTPKVDVSVPAGTHTVTFVHPDLGKKSVSIDVKAGQRANASVRFPKP